MRAGELRISTNIRMGFIKKLQTKPEREKIKILRIAVVITVIMLLIIWILTLKFRAMEKGDTSKFQRVWKNIQEFKSIFKK